MAGKAAQGEQMAKEHIDLDYPVTVDGTKISSLDMRRAKVRDQLIAEKAAATQSEQEVALFANLCEVTPDTIKELDVADYLKLQEKYKGFLSSPPKSADKGS
jgi:hypothetical protein